MLHIKWTVITLKAYFVITLLRYEPTQYHKLFRYKKPQFEATIVIEVNSRNIILAGMDWFNFLLKGNLGERVGLGEET